MNAITSHLAISIDIPAPRQPSTPRIRDITKNTTAKYNKSAILSTPIRIFVCILIDDEESDRCKIYPDEGFIDQDESSLITPMTLFKFKTFGANIYIILNLI